MEHAREAVVSIRLPAHVAQRLREVAKEDDRTVSALIRRLVVKGLDAMTPR